MSLTNRQEEIRPIFDAAIAARNAGDLTKARELCNEALDLLREPIESLAPKDSLCSEIDRKLVVVVHGELGHLHSELENLSEAEIHFKQATVASPKSELASLAAEYSSALPCVFDHNKELF